MDDFVACINSVNEFIKYNGSILETIGDCPNIEIPVNRDNIFWENIRCKGGWLCQKSVLSDRVRIVSPEGIRKANGSKSSMFEKMDRLLDDDFAREGDIIGASRNGLYEHYAIYLGNGKVIHYCGEGGDFGGRITVHEAPFDEFLKESKTYFVVWFDAGRPIKLQKSTSFLFSSSADFYNDIFRGRKRNVYSARRTIERARSRIGEQNYNIATNNCEHFAMWCKTGTSESSQVKQICAYALTVGANRL